MNVQQLFEAIRAEPEQHTLLIIAAELERQGYQVTIESKYVGLGALQKAEADGELDMLPIGIGVAVKIQKGNENQAFRVHFLDNDTVCITALQSPPVIYDPKFTTDEFR